LLVGELRFSPLQLTLQEVHLFILLAPYGDNFLEVRNNKRNGDQSP
jgi:hypothetical protein